MNHLTKIPGVPDSSEVRDGMAYFASTGPFDTTCGDCRHRGYWRRLQDRWNERSQQYETRTRFSNGCAMFHRMTGRHGPVVDAMWPSCKYFERKEADR